MVVEAGSAGGGPFCWLRPDFRVTQVFVLLTETQVGRCAGSSGLEFP